jgi:hypothetical protein
LASAPLTRLTLPTVKSDPKKLIFGTLGGIPSDLVGEPLQTILDVPRLSEEKNEEETNLESSCTGSLGAAFPPRRSLETALELENSGARVVAGSVCEESFGAFFDAIAERVSAALPRVCE